MNGAIFGMFLQSAQMDSGYDKLKCIVQQLYYTTIPRVRAFAFD